jgi:hypothetical protein
VPYRYVISTIAPYCHSQSHRLTLVNALLIGWSDLIFSVFIDKLLCVRDRPLRAFSYACVSDLAHVEQHFALIYKMHYHILIINHFMHSMQCHVLFLF